MLNYNSSPLSCHRQITLSNFDQICSLAIPNQISLTSMPVTSLVKILWHLLKLSSGNENMDVSWADNSIKIWWNPKPDLHNINAHTDRRMDRHTDVQCETIIPRHHHVAGYKRREMFYLELCHLHVYGEKGRSRSRSRLGCTTLFRSVTTLCLVLALLYKSSHTNLMKHIPCVWWYPIIWQSHSFHCCIVRKTNELTHYKTYNKTYAIREDSVQPADMQSDLSRCWSHVPSSASGPSKEG